MFAGLPHVVGQIMVGIVQDTLLTLQVSDDAHSLGIVSLWSLVSHNSPFGKMTVVLVAIVASHLWPSIVW